MSQQQTTKKGQSGTPAATGKNQPPKKTQQPVSGPAPKSQLKQAPTTRNASAWRANVKPASNGMSTPMLMGLVIGGILVLGILVIAVIAPALSNNNGPDANVPLGVEKSYPIKNGVNNHQNGTIDYSAISPYVIPPVGGPHNPYWYNCGIYAQPIPTENGVHDLEHGVVWITYQPTLDPNALTTLQGIARQYSKILLSPYPGIAAPIIASAWGGGGNTGYQIRVNAGDWTTLQAFITKHSGATDAPEAGGVCTGGKGTPIQ